MSRAGSAPIPTITGASVRRFYDDLLTHGRLGDAPFRLETRKTDGGERVLAAWLQDALARAAVGFLVRGGGWMRRTVVVEGKRVEARLFDEPVASALALRFGEASLRAAILVVDIGRSAAPRRRGLGELVGDAELGLADAVCLHLVARAVTRATPASGRADPDVDRAAAPRARRFVAFGELLRRRSPIATLFHPETREASAARASAAALAPFGASEPFALAARYLEPALASRWHRLATIAIERGATDDVLAIGDRCKTLVDIAIGARRHSLLVLGVRLAQLLLWPRGDTDPEDAASSFVTAVEDKARGRFQSIHERESFARAVADLLEPATIAGREARRIRQVPWLERTEEEKVLLADVQHEDRNLDGVDRPLLDLASAVRRRLSGEVG